MKDGPASRGAAFFLVAAVAVFFLPLLLGRVLYYDDIRDYFHLRALLRQMYEAGSFWQWNPLELCGGPTLADFQRAVFYPFTIPFYLMDTAYAHSVYVVSQYLVCTFGACFLARVAGAGRTGAVAAGLAFPFQGYVVSHLTMSPLLGAVAWLPWVLGCAARTCQTGSARWAGGCSLAVGLQLMAGHPQTSYLTTLAVVGLALLLGWRRWRVMLLAVGAVALGYLLAACELLPSLVFMPMSTRAQGMSVDFASTYATTGRMLWTLVAPYAFGAPGTVPGEERGPLFHADLEAYTGDWSLAEMGAYLGLVTLMLAAVGATAAPRRLRAGLLMAAGAAVVVALGGGLHAMLYHVLPGYGSFRAPSRLLMFTQLAVTLLAAFGVDALVAGLPRARRVASVAACVLILLMAVAPRGASLAAVGVPVGALLAAVAFTWMKPSSWAAAGLLAALFADLAFVGHGYVRTVPSAQAVQPVPALTPLLHEPRPFRLVTGTSVEIPGTTVGRAMQMGLENVQGVNPIAITRIVDYLYFSVAGRFPRTREEREVELGIRNNLFVIPDPGTPLMRLANARFMLVSAHGEMRLLVSPDALPRYWTVGDWRVVPDGEAALGLVQRGEVDPRRTALLADDWTAAPATAGAPATATVVSYEAGHAVVDVEAGAPSLMVASEVMIPGWTVTVDGSPTRLLRAFHAFMAVPVPAGRHRVELRYASPLLWEGITVSLLSLAAIAVLLRQRGVLQDVAGPPELS